MCFWQIEICFFFYVSSLCSHVEEGWPLLLLGSSVTPRRISVSIPIELDHSECSKTWEVTPSYTHIQFQVTKITTDHTSTITSHNKWQAHTVKSHNTRNSFGLKVDHSCITSVCRRETVSIPVWFHLDIPAGFASLYLANHKPVNRILR